MANKVVDFLWYCLLLVLSVIAIVTIKPLELLYLWMEDGGFRRRRCDREIHKAKVQKVLEQIKDWKKCPEGRKMCTARPAWKSISRSKTNKRGYYQVHLGDLRDVVEIDTENKKVVVEPGMKIASLTKALNAKGWTIPVVPELDTLTVGGLVAGLGIETSSHRHGFFHETVQGLEIAMPNATTVTCSRDENSDLFYAYFGSYGTLGFLMSVTLPISPMKKFVRLEYHSKPSVEDALTFMHQASSNFEFVEGIAYAKDEIVVALGNPVDEMDNSSQTITWINRWYKDGYYDQMRMAGKRGRETTGGETPLIQFVPLRDYYHRHTRTVFWLVPIVSPIMSDRLFSVLFGWGRMDVTFVSYITPRCIERLALRFRQWVIQDYIVPIDKGADMFNEAVEKLQIFPVWLCMAKNSLEPTMYRRKDMMNEDVLIDIGLYGVREQEFDFAGTLGTLERSCIDKKGIMFLYADCYMTRQDFDNMFDTELYEKVRGNADWDTSTAFPHVYDKISAAARSLQN